MGKKHRNAQRKAAQGAPFVQDRPQIPTVSQAALLDARKTENVGLGDMWRLSAPFPGVLPNEGASLANDAAIKLAFDYANESIGNGFFTNGRMFLGYPYLAELAQIAEYRRISEIIAKEMTRKWIEFETSGDAGDTKLAKKVAQLKAAFKRYRVKKIFKQIAETDGFFGRAHLYIDTGDTLDDDEMQVPLVVDPRKIKKGALKGFRVVEPIWTYPTAYNSTSPLADDFYRPALWYVMGKQIHNSRLLTFVSREVPDMLKPIYQFGGLSLSQIAKTYVDNWLRTQKSVSDTVYNFSNVVMKTDLDSIMQEGNGMTNPLLEKVMLFNMYRSNRGTILMNTADTFEQVSTPLGGLEGLQAQAQEHMAAVSGIPLVKLLGIQPAGLNASSDGEIRVFYDWIAAQQEDTFYDHLHRVFQIIQCSEFGEIDDRIGFRFEPLWSLDEAAKASIRKTNADTASIYIADSVIGPEEERERIAHDEASPYQSLDLSVTIKPPEGEEDDEDEAKPSTGGDPAASAKRASTVSGGSGV